MSLGENVKFVKRCPSPVLHYLSSLVNSADVTHEVIPSFCIKTQCELVLQTYDQWLEARLSSSLSLARHVGVLVKEKYLYRCSVAGLRRHKIQTQSEADRLQMCSDRPVRQRLGSKLHLQDSHFKISSLCLSRRFLSCSEVTNTQNSTLKTVILEDNHFILSITRYWGLIFTSDKRINARLLLVAVFLYCSIAKFTWVKRLNPSPTEHQILQPRWADSQQTSELWRWITVMRCFIFSDLQWSQDNEIEMIYRGHGGHGRLSSETEGGVVWMKPVSEPRSEQRANGQTGGKRSHIDFIVKKKKYGLFLY